MNKNLKWWINNLNFFFTLFVEKQIYHTFAKDFFSWIKTNKYQAGENWNEEIPWDLWWNGHLATDNELWIHFWPLDTP